MAVLTLNFDLELAAKAKFGADAEDPRLTNERTNELSNKHARSQ